MNKQFTKIAVGVSFVAITSLSIFTFCQKAHETPKNQGQICGKPTTSKSVSVSLDSKSEAEMMAAAIKFNAWRNSCLDKMIVLENRLRDFVRLDSLSDRLYSGPITEQSETALDSVIRLMDKHQARNLALLNKVKKEVISQLGEEHAFSKKISRFVRQLENSCSGSSLALVEKADGLTKELYGIEGP